MQPSPRILEYAHFPKKSRGLGSSSHRREGGAGAPPWPLPDPRIQATGGPSRGTSRPAHRRSKALSRRLLCPRTPAAWQRLKALDPPLLPRHPGCSVVSAVSVSDEARAEVNGLKASRFFSLAERLNAGGAPFIWLFIRPPWSVSGSCCKAVVHESLRAECQLQKVSRGARGPGSQEVRRPEGRGWCPGHVGDRGPWRRRNEHGCGSIWKPQQRGKASQPGSGALGDGLVCSWTDCWKGGTGAPGSSGPKPGIRERPSVRRGWAGSPRIHRRRAALWKLSPPTSHSRLLSGSQGVYTALPRESPEPLRGESGRPSHWGLCRLASWLGEHAERDGPVLLCRSQVLRTREHVRGGRRGLQGSGPRQALAVGLSSACGAEPCRTPGLFVSRSAVGGSPTPHTDLSALEKA